jgi:hypothetical protein
MIDLNTIGRWTLRAWIVFWPIAYLGAMATNDDLHDRLETRTESYRACMGVES